MLKRKRVSPNGLRSHEGCIVQIGNSSCSSTLGSQLVVMRLLVHAAVGLCEVEARDVRARASEFEGGVGEVVAHGVYLLTWRMCVCG